jgi:hypothetical protein
MQQVFWDLPHQPAYHLERIRIRPWVLIRDAEGFGEDLCNDYLVFAAWQDRPRGQIWADARWLADAATWLHRTATAQWATTDQDRWAVFLQDITLGYDNRQQVASSRAFRAVAALHRAYAFWHWRDPRHFPIQPFPSTGEARHRWVEHVMDIVDYFPGGWPN